MNMRLFYRSLPLLLGFLSVQTSAAGTEVNIAGWGTATQSTIYMDGLPVNALNGISPPCTHTIVQTLPWWRLDLQKSYSVNRVSITNRLDCCSERINGAEIRIGDVPSDVFSNPVCAIVSTIPAGQTFSYSCNGMQGRYVFVDINAPSSILTLCAVGVFVVFPDNLATGKNVMQSSTYSSWIPEQAIDFNPGLSDPSIGCSSTNGQTDPWWRLDLGHIYQVSTVVVTNRLNCCPERINGAEIHIGNSLENNGNNNPICAVISSIPAGVSATFACNNMEGRYVSLLIRGEMKYITLCEVEVYGQGPCLKQSLMKLKLNSSFSLSEVRLLTQLESALAQRGFSDVTLQWTQLPKQEVIRKKVEQAHCAQTKR
ncbi:uncharacterized protein LOC793213 precursor [Danio rerio]|uniref:Uncharacterized protein LOC793213 precursor n=1 Tax=Danio rerio TaxID=7955 RepID=A8WFS4_DANRE|nr:uncharacterized protein LOC793213 precursor [Danio rerio]AAI54438.1 Zgc:171424 protein [Danio rerio]|eukprot:NP_001108054.1 uncharacterized protein LOC793213 precursor [Danio rerio]